ncbi:hypothetical protein L7F22_009356 [Adiantum nelumboides]|nr:hypothetical protein [Adiantum nelumboides]
MSGLGIDFGSPASSISSGSRKHANSHIQQQKRPRSMQLTESLNQFNDINRRSIPSKQQGVSRPMSAIEPGKTYASGPMNRNTRLGAAVAAMGDRDWDSASNATPSDMYSPTSSSPKTETSATSFATSAAGKNGLKRTQTVRKQMSQPNLSRASTMVKRNTTDAPSQPQQQQQQRISRGPPSPDDNARGMIRSKSSMSLASQYRTNQPGQASLSRSTTSGSTSLGRTSEIPRSASRATAGRGRGGSMRGGMASNRRSTLEVQQNQHRSSAGDIMMIDGKRMKADGFGGYVEMEKEQVSEPPTIESPKVAKQEQQQQQRSSLAPTQIPKPRPRSYTMGQLPPPAALRVGSFYGPDGEERARIDEDGRLSQHRNSVSESSDGPAPSSHHSSNASGRSAGPRLQFMTSPGASAQSAANSREGTSVASGKSNAHSSTAIGDGKGQLHKSVSMRSAHGFRGLNAAERGEAMVSLDDLNRYASTGYEEGEYILPGRTRTMDDESILQSVRLESRRDSTEDSNQSRTRPGKGHMRQASAPAGLHKLEDETNVRRQNATQLDRHGTLISSASNPARRSKDLNRLLGNNSGKLTSSASSDAGSSLSSASALSKSSNSAANTMTNIMPQAVLEHGKSGKSRVDVDLILESELVVEGGMLTGRLEVKVRKNNTKDGHLMLSQPKVRVVGFEELVNDDSRHIFYHYATVIDGCTKVGKNVSQPYVLHGSPNLSPEADNRQPLACFASQPDSEGYCVAKEGQHSIPFALELPVGKGAKGTYRGKHAVVRYIVIGSVKLKSENGSNRSIAHFYRHIDLYPYLNPAIVLAGSGKPVQAKASKGLFLGGSGKVHLIASLHRSSWVAGQRLYVHLRIDNETSKRVKSLTMTLIRTVILYRPRPEFDMALSAPDDPSETYIDPDACTTSTSRKKICEDVLEMGQKGAKGTVTARGWWTGVEAGEAIELSHNMKLPVDALTIVRGRHVEVSYSLKISVGSSLSSDVSVELPVRIVNFVSLDPPPLKSSIKHVTPSRMNGRNAISDSEAPMIARVRSMEALKSPQRIGGNEFVSANGIPNDGRYLNVHRHVNAMQMTNTTTRNLLPEDPETAKAKKLQHQKSLDFINHAIRSATARRVGSGSSNGPSPTGLGIEVDEARTPLAEESSGASSISDDSSSYVSGSSAASISSASAASEAIHPSCKPYQHNNNYPPIVSLSGVVGGPRPIYMPSHSISLDDADDDSDDEYNAGEQTLILNDDSVADIDMVIGSAQVDGGESSPEFSQNRGMERFGGDLTIGGEEDESDISTSTITSNDENLYNDRLEDEFDEEEERLTAIRQRQNQDQDDGPTPLARSPPKFQSNNPVRPTLNRNMDSSMSSPSDGNMSDSLSGYASTASSNAMSTNSARELAEAKREGKTVVRTRSDLEKRLGRSSTIIRGPTTNSSRPVSPSKQAPSPVKSALKTKSSFTFATAEQPIKHQQQKTKTAPLTMPAASVRAKVDPHKALNSHKNPRQSAPPMKQHQRIQMASDSEMSMSSGSSESSNSPATSASALTPREQMSELEDGIPFDADKTIHASDLGGLGLQLQPIVHSVGVEDGMSKSKSVSMINPSTQPKKASLHPIPTSVSTRNVNQTSGVVAPSVRDKIAMLESRKRALQEFTAGGGGGLEVPNGETVGTPPSSRNARLNSTPKQDPDTPTRVQAAAKSFLERNNSVLSQSSSVATSVQPDYLRNMSSVQSFKAPLLREK